MVRADAEANACRTALIVTATVNNSVANVKITGKIIQNAECDAAVICVNNGNLSVNQIQIVLDSLTMLKNNSGLIIG